MLLNTVSDKLDIIVLAGQSNAEGYGIGHCIDEYKPTPRILAMRDTDNQGYVVNEKTRGTFNIRMPRDYLIGLAEERCSTSGKIGNLGVYFARRYVQDLDSDRRVLLIHCAVGATGFAKKNWGIGSVLYERMVEMCTLALRMNPENRIAAVLWHQGEHDAIFRPALTDKEREETHYNDLSSMLTDFRQRFGICPFIMGDFTDAWKASCENSRVIVSAMQSIVSDFSKVGFTSSSGLKTNSEEIGNGDTFHFSRNSLCLLGERYYDVYKLISNKY